MLRIGKYLFFTIVFISSVIVARAGNKYVSALLGSDSYAGTFQNPFATIQKAADLTIPGDTVFIMNGTYLPTKTGVQDILDIKRSGTAAKYITYKAYPGHTPKLKGSINLTWQVWCAIAIDASYIIVDGLEVEGNNANLTYQIGYQGYLDYSNGIKDFVKLSRTEMGGVSIGKNLPKTITPSQAVHHIIVRNCKLHDCGGNGGSKCDYVTFENNIVYNNCWYSYNAGSGLSILGPVDIDTITSYKIFIRNNIVYNNKTLVPWEQINAFSDGNGIILDINNGTQFGNTFTYNGRYLLTNNVCYNNGGGGIHAYLAKHIDIINNTCYNNGTVVGYPEIDANGSADVRVYNNIMYARTGASCNGNDAGIYDYNLYYNGNVYKAGSNSLIANPQFINLALDSTGTPTANFQLKNFSPAINAGADASISSTNDLLGISRPQGYNYDIGAYEFTGVPSMPANFSSGNMVALRVGNRSSTLDTKATGVSILEYTSAGIATTNSIVVGNASSVAPNRMVLSGDNTTGEGQLSLSGDGRFLVIAGYDGAVGDSASVYQAGEKIIARVDYNGIVDYTTRLPASTMNRTIRTAITDSSSRYYLTGTNVSPATGNSTRFLNFGTPSTTASTAFTGGVRSLKMFGGVVYYANNNIVGYLTPNPASGNYATTTTLTGVSLNGYNFQSFVLLNFSPTANYNGTGYDLLYCADQSLGLVKFYWNGATWVLAGTNNPTSPTGITGGLQDITARINSAGKPEIFVVKGAASNNNILMLTDNNSLNGSIATNNPTINFSIAAGVNYMFRGVAFTPIYNQTNVSWVGNANTNWNTAGNWSSNKVPDSLVSVKIPTGCTNYPIIDVSNTNNAVNNLTIQSNSLMNNGGLSIKNSLNSNGVITGSGTVTFNGSAAQNVSGTGKVSNFTLNNANGATIDSLGKLTITGTLKLKLGILTTNGNLELNSDSTGTAMLGYYGINGNTGTINGAISVERYIPAKSARKYVFISSPITQSVRNGWQQQVYITGNGTGGSVCGSTSGNGTVSTDKYNSNGFDVSPTSVASLYTYNATPNNGTRWLSISNTTSTNLTAGIGYRANIRGNRNSSNTTCNNQLNSSLPAPPEAVTLITSGTVTTGDRIIALNHFNDHRYTLLGNPYPSPISFTSFQSANSSRINNKMWTYSPYSQTAGNYTTYSNGICANQALGYDATNGDYIAVGQAFFVEANSQGSVTFRENDKIINSPPNNQYFGTSAQKILRIALMAANANTRFDEVVIQYAKSGTKTYNTAIDAISFNGGNQVLYAIKDISMLAIAARPDSFVIADTAQLGFRVSSTGKYRLVFSGFNSVSNVQSIFLKDAFLSRLIDLSINNEYEFSVTSDTLSMGNSRFQIIANTPSLLPIKTIALSARKESGVVLIDWKIDGEEDLSNYEVQKSTDGISFKVIGIVKGKENPASIYTFLDSNAMSQSFYRIKAVGIEGKNSYSNTVTLNNANEKKKFTLFPSPLLGNKLHVSFPEIGAGVYLITITTAIGQRITQKAINHSGRAGNYTLNVNDGLMNGQYYVSIYKEDKRLVYNGTITIQR